MLRRYLCGSARERPHQETQVCEWLHRMSKRFIRIATVLPALQVAA